jgi:predicted branched-subunit amino acid permease
MQSADLAAACRLALNTLRDVAPACATPLAKRRGFSTIEPSPPPDPSGAVFSPANFSRAGFKRGFWRAQPMALGIFFYGMAFGLLAREASLSLAEAMAMSAFVYSGTAQLAAVSAIAAAPGALADAALAILAAVLLLNARYLLYSAALRPWLGAMPAHRVYPTLFFMGDGNWVLSMQAYAMGERDGGFVLGSGIATFAPWLLGTMAGLLAGGLIANPAMLGLDFLLVAFSAAMGAAMLKLQKNWAGMIAAALVALVVDRLAPGGWTIVAAGLAGGIVTFIRFRPEGQA